MRTTRSRALLPLAVATAVGVVLVASACSSTPPVSTVVAAGAVDDSARDYVLAAMQERAAIQDAVWVESSLDDLLPNHEFSIEGAKAAPLAEGIVVGTITAAEPGSGYMIEGDDAVDGVEIPFTDPRSLWRVIVLTVTTEKRLGDVDDTTIRVGVVIDGGMDTIRARDGYLSLGRVALVLNEPGKFAFDPSVYSIRQSGALLGVISTSGIISFPALGVENRQFVGSLDTVAEIVAGSRQRAVVVDVEQTMGEFLRDDE